MNYSTSRNTDLRGNEGLNMQNSTKEIFLRIVILLAEFYPVLKNLLNNEP